MPFTADQLPALRNSLAIYRMVFGQPRQDELRGHRPQLGRRPGRAVGVEAIDGGLGRLRRQPVLAEVDVLTAVAGIVGAGDPWSLFAMKTLEDHVPNYKAAAAVGMVATGDPWTALGLKLWGDSMWR